MSDDKDGIYSVETVPPPDGEPDAYNAPTKIGPMAAAYVNEMVEHAARKANDLPPVSRPPSVPNVPMQDVEAMPISAASPRSTKPPPDSSSGSLPKLRTEEDDEFDPSGDLEPSSLIQQINASLPPAPVEEPAPVRSVTDPDDEDGVFESPIAATRPEWEAASRAEPPPAPEPANSRTYLLVFVLLALLAVAGYLFVAPRLH